MPEAHEINAIVVGYTDYGESDQIARLLSPQLGLISVMGRGTPLKAQAIRRHRSGQHHSPCPPRKKGELWTLTSAQLKEGYLKIQDHIHKLALLSYCCEIKTDSVK